jgi:hypothetical protein
MEVSMNCNAIDGIGIMEQSGVVVNNEELNNINKVITKLEKELMSTAPDSIKKLYQEIDFYRSRVEYSLKKY